MTMNDPRIVNAQQRAAEAWRRYNGFCLGRIYSFLLHHELIEENRMRFAEHTARVEAALVPAFELRRAA